MTTAPPRPRARMPVHSAVPSPRRPAPKRRPVSTASKRLRVGRVLLVAALGIATLKLVIIQSVQASDLNAASSRQLLTEIPLPAERGSILDSAGKPLAFSIEANALVTNPRTIARTHGAGTADYVTRMASVVGQATGQDPPPSRRCSPRQGLRRTGQARRPGVAQRCTTSSPRSRSSGGRRASTRAGRSPRTSSGPPPGSHRPPGSSPVGSALRARRTTCFGLERRPRGRTAEGSRAEIPGSVRYERPAVPGSTLQLTLDSDLQYTVQRDLSAYIAKTRAKPDSSVVVLDVASGKVRALATGQTFDPTNAGAATADQLGDPAVTSPYEPGSVNKIVTMSAAIEYGVAKPDDVLDVPASIRVADRTINDAWKHGLTHFTLTGVLAKSSNVGTIMTAQKVGPERFADMLARFGLGQKTGVGLPGESPGSVPPMATWSGSTFGNLPIGQGLSMTVLEMAGMYQAVANNGLRIPPRIIESTVSPDGVRTVPPSPAGVQVVSPPTAATLRTMLTAVTQDERNQRGTGPTAAFRATRRRARPERRSRSTRCAAATRRRRTGSPSPGCSRRRTLATSSGSCWTRLRVAPARPRCSTTSPPTSPSATTSR